MKLGEFKNARSITNSVLNIIEKNNVEVVSMNIVNIDSERIKIDFVIKSNNYDKNKLTASVEKEFRYQDWNDNFEIVEVDNYINVIFYIK